MEAVSLQEQEAARKALRVVFLWLADRVGLGLSPWVAGDGGERTVGLMGSERIGD